MKYHVRNMVCNRCILAVREIFTAAGYEPESVVLGEVQTSLKIGKEEYDKINSKLKSIGFEIIDDKRSKTIEQIKNVIVKAIHHDGAQSQLNLSSLIEDNLGKDYSYLSNLFSSIEGVTLEKYFISQKVERVKELIVYDELTLSEIAYKMGYSSVAHLSSQFKKVTGLTPTFFRQMGSEKRKPLDQVN